MISKFQKVYDKKTQTYKFKKVWPFWLDLIVTLFAAAVIAVVVNLYVLEPFWIPSGSMRATLEVDDKIWVEKIGVKLNGVHKGDVVVFKDPGDWMGPAISKEESQTAAGLLGWLGFENSDNTEYLVKRVIGTEFDRVKCAGPGFPIEVNGVAVDEPYIFEGQTPSEVPFDVEVPKGMIWVMGDNRGNSKDSRFHADAEYKGFVPVDDVVGDVVFRFAPWDRFGLFPDYHSSFAQVPVPSQLALGS
ncbi:MAG: signal peptidase I [Bifidobacteriaceae bacterium]|nr:signal peptidase I [Bifidobacteriaceae bacterium]